MSAGNGLDIEGLADTEPSCGAIPGIVTAHKFAWLATHPRTKFSGRQTVVMHRCDNPSCVNPNHLKLGTAKDNVQDCLVKGRGNRSHGTGRYNAKLSDALARKIFLTFNGSGLNKFASKYGVKRQAISNIMNRKTWKHATKDIVRAEP